MFVFGIITYYLLIDRTLRQMYVVQLAVTVGLQILMRSAALIIWKAQPRALQYSFIQGNFEIGGFTDPDLSPGCRGCQPADYRWDRLLPE